MVDPSQTEQLKLVIKFLSANRESRDQALDIILGMSTNFD